MKYHELFQGHIGWNIYIYIIYIIIIRLCVSNDDDDDQRRCVYS